MLETFVLETKIFGYVLILDEVLEGLIHSSIYHLINNKFLNPMFSFRILSSFAGLFLLGILVWKNKNNLFPILIIFSSCASMLFFGYVENYTYVTLLLLVFQFIGIEFLRRDDNHQKSLFFMTIIASIAIMFHLISGYLIFSLIYLCLAFSVKGNFWKNAFFSTLIGLSILGLVFGYFFLFSEVRFDLTLSHVSNHKFYPIKRIISIPHFMEIFYCMIFTSLSSLTIIIFFYLREKEIWKKVISRKEVKFLSLVLLGFLIHGLLHNPQLGFPTDWDLMSFYWTPFAMLAFMLLKEKTELYQKFLPVILFSLIITISNAFILNKEDPEKTKELNVVLNAIDEFAPKYKNRLEKIHPNDRKFHLNISFFLFKSRMILTSLNENEEIKSLIKENLELNQEFDLNFHNRNKEWNKNFLERATKFNIRFIEYSKNLK